MTAGGRGLLPLVLVCAAAVLTVGARESRVHRHRFRTSWSRPHQTHRLAATTAATTTSRDTTNPLIISSHHRNTHHRQHHHHNNKYHRFFTSRNHHHSHHRNSTLGHRTSTRYILPGTNHNQRRHNRNRLTISNHHYHHHGNNTTRNNHSGGRNHHHQHHRYTNNKHNQGSHSRKHYNRHHHFRNHMSKFLANQDFPKQSIKRHLGGMKRQSHHHTPFLRPMRMHTSFRSALVDSLSFHRHPQLWDMSRLQNHHQRIMDHLSSRLRDRVMRMRPHSVPHVVSSHHHHFSHHRPSHSFHSGQRVHCRHDQPRHHGSRAEGGARTGTQFTKAPGGHGSVPEDVEVFRWPIIPQSPPQPTTTTTTTTTTTPRPIIIEDSTKVTNSNPYPHQPDYSRGRPSYKSPSSPTHLNPVHPIINALFPSHTPSTPAWEGRGKDSRPTPVDPTTIPCIKCPPDTRVQAPRGRDCVYAQTPSPLPCNSQWNPNVQTIVTEGPAPGTRLQEGHYAISFTVVVMEGESRGATPIATCRVGYDVEVRKCPELPWRAGLEARCSAGRAWGSQCTWYCAGNLKLRGAASTTCSGHRHPRWTHEPPSCIAPPTTTPHPPPTSRGCKAPPDVPGGQYSCKVLVGSPVNVPIPKDDPSIPRTPRETNPAHHVEGTVCELNCGHGWTIAVSQRGRRRLTCTAGGHWDHRPPSCRLQVSPVLQDGDCKDTTLKPPHSPLSFLPLPNFRTSSGVAARVTCVLEARSEGSHTRTCTAEDPELETATHCKYRITLLDATPNPDAVLLPGLSGSVGTADNPGGKGEHQAGGDIEWEEERQHPNNGHSDSTGQRHDLYPYISKEDNDDDYYDYDDEDEDEDEFDYYYDGSNFDDGDFIDDYSSEFETVPELQRVQGQTLGTGRKREGSRNTGHRRRGKKHRINLAERNSTKRRTKTHQMHHLRKTKKTSLSTPSPSSSFSFSSLNQPSPSSSNHRSTVVAENVTTGGKNSGSAMLKGAGDAQQANTKGRRAHHVTSGQENRDKIHHTHQRKHLSGKQTLPKNLHKYTVKENENGTLTKKVDWRKGAQLTSPPPTDERRLSGAQGQGTQSRPPSDKEGIPATMEAVVRMEVAVGSCSVGREVARLLGKTLKKQELCGTGLTCHNPRHTCKETRDTLTEAGRARVEVLWAVGGLYEYDEANGSRYHPAPQQLPRHVPEVETAISAILESTRGILTSHGLAQSLAALGAEVDPSSFLVTQLDLVCRQPGLTLRPETNRCWPN